MNPLLFKGFKIRIPIVISTQGRGFTNQGSTLECRPLIKTDVP